jgi:predicted DNA-binding transcriptional regulator YafY
MNRIDRLTAILIQMQTKRVVKAEEIADRFEISLRTVYRDVKALMEAGCANRFRSRQRLLYCGWISSSSSHVYAGGREVQCYLPENSLRR